MNEFTKEELIWMRDNYRGFMQIGVKGIPQLPVIINKLNHIIDNYCNYDYAPPIESKIPHVCGDCGKEVFGYE